MQNRGNMIKWLFFDVGNVILNDDPAMAMYYKYIYEVLNQNGKNITFNELLQHREQAIIQNRDGKHYYTVGLKYFEAKRWRKEIRLLFSKLMDNWESISPLIPGIVPVIETLSRKYNLGLIANQPRITEAILKDHQLLQYFKVNCISELVGYKKPDRRIFKYALKSAECSPEEAVMIGDRIDNDVAPAKAMGLKTLWFKLPLEKKGYEPANELEKLYFQSIKRACVSQLPPLTNEEQPNFVAESFEEIVSILS